MAQLLHLMLLLPPVRPPLPIDYCAICPRPGEHTLCRYPFPGPSPNCTGYIPAPLSLEEKRTLLDTHNSLRSRVALGHGWSPNSTYDAQPKASNMRQVYWDPELEAIAQRWADRCDNFNTNHPHDDCRQTSRFPVGQNIVTSAYNFPAPPDVRSRTHEWYNEIEDFNPDWVSSFVLQPAPGKTTAHYTQLVWGWTYLLGCGRAVFHEAFDGQMWMVERLVCNYGPSGNYFNAPVYKQGEPCSQCPNGTKCSDTYPGICEIDNSYQNITTAMPPLSEYYTTPSVLAASTTRRVGNLGASSTTETMVTTMTPETVNEKTENDVQEQNTENSIVR